MMLASKDFQIVVQIGFVNLESFFCPVIKRSQNKIFLRAISDSIKLKRDNLSLLSSKLRDIELHVSGTTAGNAQTFLIKSELV